MANTLEPMHIKLTVQCAVSDWPPYKDIINTVVINRLRVGHTRFTNSYLLKGENQPECQACQSALTVKHILVDYTRLSAALSGLVNTMS